MLIYFSVYLSDSTIATGSQGVTGLTPTVASLKTTGASPADVSSHAAVSEVGNGWYQVAYDAELYGEAAGVLDGSASLPVNADRYRPIAFARDSSRIQTGIDPNGFTVAYRA